MKTMQILTPVVSRMQFVDRECFCFYKVVEQPLPIGKIVEGMVNSNDLPNHCYIPSSLHGIELGKILKD
jgi:hypothetical protein